jgi:hypothetical protein
MRGGTVEERKRKGRTSAPPLDGAVIVSLVSTLVYESHLFSTLLYVLKLNNLS